MAGLGRDLAVGDHVTGFQLVEYAGHSQLEFGPSRPVVGVRSRPGDNGVAVGIGRDGVRRHPRVTVPIGPTYRLSVKPLDVIHSWPANRAAAAVIAPDGSVNTAGDIDAPFELASLTKLITALAVLVASEEGSLSLDQVVTDAGATVGDLLSHAGGMAPDTADQITAPRTRRVYSTAAYDRLGEIVTEHTGMRFADYLAEGVLAPLGMVSSALHGSPGADSTSNVRDLIALASAWIEPMLVHDTTLGQATTAVHPELGGVLPGFGRFDVNPWGLGPEVRGDKDPHWTGRRNSSATYGHFGRAGTMLWIDPVAKTTLIALTDEPFGAWAASLWPALSDAVLEAI
jgi:CubicO group peptidase (beta-lactamase class C family)